MRKLSRIDVTKLVGWSVVAINGGQAVKGVVTGSYLYAGCMIAIGIVWIGILGFIEDRGIR